MKKSLIILILSCWTVAAAFAQGGGYVDDLYRGSTRKSRQAEAQAAAEAQKRVRKQQTQQQMPVNWTPAQAASEASSAAVVEPSAGGDELVTSYDEALQRRLDAYKNYKEMDDSYWQLMESYHKMLEAKYDPELYNVITFGNEMWVEPVYISALFDGSDPAAGIRSKEFTAPSGGSVNISLNLGPGWWWDDPWDFGWYAPWNYPWRWGYYGWAGPYWGPSWRWGWNWTWGWRPSWSWGPAWGWGPSWDWGPSWGWGPGWWPGGPVYHPPHWGGGGHGPYHGRPVIWGNRRPGWGPAPGYRPGGGGGSGRPGYSGGFRRNENGTGVSINSGSGAVNRRPGSGIRPGSSGNQYNPAVSSRPTVSGGNSGNVSRPSVDRSYRRQTSTMPAPRRETTTRTQTPQRSEPSRSAPVYSAPSRGSGGGTIGGGGSSGGGGGYRRR